MKKKNLNEKVMNNKINDMINSKREVEIFY